MQYIDSYELFDSESERAVLSCIMHEEKAIADIITEISEEDFYLIMHKNIFTIIVNLFKQNVRPTYVEVLKEGHKLGVLRSSSDLEEVKYVAESYIDYRNLDYWKEQLIEKTKLRKIENFLRTSYIKLKENTADIDTFINQLNLDLTNASSNISQDNIKTPEQLAELGIAELEQRFERYQQVKSVKNVEILDGLSTGFKSLNSLTLGYKPGELVVVGAQTGHGKTAFALQTAYEIAINKKTPVLYLNTEMSEKQIVLRMGSVMSQTVHDKIRKGDLTEKEFESLKASYNSDLSNSNLFTYKCPNLTEDEINFVAKKFKTQYGIEMIIVDYIGRMDKYDSKQQEYQVLERITKNLKILAQNLNIAVMALVQLNQDSSLQGTKRIQNECDLLLKLQPLEEDDDNANLEEYGVNYFIHVAKNRDGQSQIHIPVHFNKQKQTIRDVSVASRPEVVNYVS